MPNFCMIFFENLKISDMLAYPGYVIFTTLLQAPQWSVRLVYNNNPRTSLAHVIKKFEKIWNLSRFGRKI